MSPQTKSLLEKFATFANWNTVGLPSDMERFREFVISAFKNGEYSLSLDEFLGVVNSCVKNTEADYDMKISDKKRILSSKMFMFNQYEDGIKLLRKYEGK
jgi:hypothetical protein